jgi:hypothetical protein
MKTKKFDKKLLLNKKTIAHLDNGEMLDLRGGISGSRCDVETCPLLCPPETGWVLCPSAPWTNCTAC